MPEEKHHPMSPSKLKRFQLCPGSFKLSKGLKDEPSPYAQEGTAMHKAVETGQILDDFNEEQKDCIQQCIDYIEMIAPKNAERLMEQEISVMDGFELLTEGTADVVLVTPDLIIGIDWKFGRSPVMVENNSQIKAYSAGLMQKYKRPVEFHIGQPRLHYFKSVRYELTELPSFISEIKRIREDCLSPMMILNPSDEACKYCLAKKTCPAVNSVMDNTELTTIEHTGELSANQLGEYLDKAKLLEDIIKRLKFRAKEHLLKGEEVPGWGLQNRKGATVVKDAQGAYNQIKEFVPLEKFMECLTVKYTSLVDAYSKGRKEVEAKQDVKVTLKQLKSEIEEQLAPFVERASDSVSLVQKSEG